MNQEFVTQLQLQLREAALREERRAPFAQRVVRARRGLPGPGALAAALAVALLALAVALGALELRGEPEPTKPKVIDTFIVSNGLSSVAYGFGAVWVADPIKGEVLRIDPDTRKVTARVAVGGEVQVAVGAGAVWALGGDLLTAGALGPVRLTRIDPRSNRVVARIPMRSPGGDNFAPLSVQADGAHVWVCGASGALRINPAGNVADRFVAFRGQAVDFEAAGERVWVLLPDGRLHELDARTGRVLAAVRLRGARDAQLGPGRPGTLTLTDRNRLTLIERSTGRTLWRATLGGTISGWIPDDDALWVHVSRAPGAGDQLVRVDADTGRPTGQVALFESEAASLAKVGREVWIATPGGALVVVR